MTEETTEPTETAETTKTVLERVTEVIDEIRPYIQQDGGDIELVEVTPENVVNVRLKGACATCPGAVMTLKAGVETHMKEKVPEIASVERVE
jgi:Fe-S cluster biogenesis protein NfuA